MKPANRPLSRKASRKLKSASNGEKARAIPSFGGPAGQIALMHRILVEEQKWLGEKRFLHALNYCMLLPGPEAMQLAVYIGWLMHRTLGGIISGLLVVLPGEDGQCGKHFNGHTIPWLRRRLRAERLS